MRLEFFIRTDGEWVDSEKTEKYCSINIKCYESDTLDEDMINASIGKSVDRLIISDLQITTKDCIDNVIRMLEKTKESLR